MTLCIKDLAIRLENVVEHQMLDQRYSADAENELPSIVITGIPPNTKELVVICHDPDAPLPHGFTHCVIYGLEPTKGRIQFGADSFGPNGLGQRGWSGPQPPIGHGLHHYYFWVYALSRNVDGCPTREKFLAEYGDVIIEQARIVVHYRR